MARRAKIRGGRPEEIPRGRLEGRPSRKRKVEDGREGGEDACMRLVKAATGRQGTGSLDTPAEGTSAKREASTARNFPPSARRRKGAAGGGEKDSRETGRPVGSAEVGPAAMPQEGRLAARDYSEERVGLLDAERAETPGQTAGPRTWASIAGGTVGSQGGHLTDAETTGAKQEERNEAAPSHESAQVDGTHMAYGKGHRVVRTGSIAWCVRCGAHAEARVGVAMSRECTLVLEGEKSGRAYRRSLLLRGMHPISKKKLQ